MAETSILVAHDAQASLFSTLMPYHGFSTDYQGRRGGIPIMFTEGGTVLDPRAGEPGYSPNLLAGLTVPMGARIFVWLPLASFFVDDQNQSVLYNWYFIWRVRNVRDYLTSRVAYHYPKQGVGFNNQVVLPACFETVAYTDPGPSVGQTNGSSGVVARTARQTLFTNVYQPQNVRDAVGNSQALPTPLLPGGVSNQAVIQQGIPGVTTASMAEFVVVDVTALGDDLLIGCTKDDPTNAIDWDFTGPDEGFAQLFDSGSPDLGVYVSVVTPAP